MLEDAITAMQAWNDSYPGLLSIGVCLLETRRRDNGKPFEIGTPLTNVSEDGCAHGNEGMPHVEPTAGDRQIQPPEMLAFVGDDR
jgi:hypothetical protein